MKKMRQESTESTIQIFKKLQKEIYKANIFDIFASQKYMRGEKKERKSTKIKTEIHKFT